MPLTHVEEDNLREGVSRHIIPHVAKILAIPEETVPKPAFSITHDYPIFGEHQVKVQLFGTEFIYDVRKEDLSDGTYVWKILSATQPLDNKLNEAYVAWLWANAGKVEIKPWSKNVKVSASMLEKQDHVEVKKKLVQTGGFGRCYMCLTKTQTKSPSDMWCCEECAFRHFDNPATVEP